MILNSARLAAVGTVAGVITGILTRSFMPSESSANHPKGPPHDHIGSINSFEPEDFCVMIEDSSMDFGTAYSRVSSTLMADNPGADWNRLNGSLSGDKLAFSATGPTPCDENPNRSKIELEYRVSAPGVCGAWSCAFPLGQQYNDPISGHREWPWYVVSFNTSHINQANPAPGQPKPWWHVINHETGHMLGLDDPRCVADPVNPGSDFECPPGWKRECGAESVRETYGVPDSVMHPQSAYGCDENYEWPSANDWDSVLALFGGQQTGPSGTVFFPKAW